MWLSVSFYKMPIFNFQLLSAFEKALQLTENVPSDDHKQLTQDYIKCLSKVCTPFYIFCINGSLCDDDHIGNTVKNTVQT